MVSVVMSKHVAGMVSYGQEFVLRKWLVYSCIELVLYVCYVVMFVV